MGLITIFKAISFLLFISFLFLAIYESFKVFMYFNKETKKRIVYKMEYYLKAKKMLLYSLAFAIASVIFGIVKTL
jgi:hypothetical protein